MRNKPIRHAAGKRNRRKMLHFAENLVEELEYMNSQMRNLLDEHLRYSLGRAARLLNRIRAIKGYGRDERKR